MPYVVIDRHTLQRVGEPCDTFGAARARMDRLNDAEPTGDRERYTWELIRPSQVAALATPERPKTYVGREFRWMGDTWTVVGEGTHDLSNARVYIHAKSARRVITSASGRTYPVQMAGWIPVSVLTPKEPS